MFLLLVSAILNKVNVFVTVFSDSKENLPNFSASTLLSIFTFHLYIYFQMPLITFPSDPISNPENIVL